MVLKIKNGEKKELNYMILMLILFLFFIYEIDDNEYLYRW